MDRWHLRNSTDDRAASDQLDGIPHREPRLSGTVLCGRVLDDLSDLILPGLVNIQKTMENHHVSWENYGKSPCLMGKSTINLASFNSYVKLPEGMFMEQLNTQMKVKMI